MVSEALWCVILAYIVHFGYDLMFVHITILWNVMSLKDSLLAKITSTHIAQPQITQLIKYCTVSKGNYHGGNSEINYFFSLDQKKCILEKSWLFT